MKKKQNEMKVSETDRKKICEKKTDVENGEMPDKMPSDKKPDINTDESPEDKNRMFLKATLATLCLVIAIMLIPYGQSIWQDEENLMQTALVSDMAPNKAEDLDEAEKTVLESEKESNPETETESETEKAALSESMTETTPESELESESNQETAAETEKTKESEPVMESENADSLDSTEESDSNPDNVNVASTTGDMETQQEAQSQANAVEIQEQEQQVQSKNAASQTYNAATLSVTGIPNTLLNYIANRYELQYTLYDFLWRKGYRNNVSASVSGYEIDPDARGATIYFLLSDGNSVTGVYDLDGNAYSYS